MTELQPAYTTIGTPDAEPYYCRGCGTTLGLICRTGRVTYLLFGRAKIYHADIECRCGCVTRWSMNEASYERLMKNYE